MGVLSNLAGVFGNWRQPAASTALAPATPAAPGRPRKPTASSSEKIGATLGIGVGGRVNFLPYMDSATGDTPEVRIAMRQMLKDPYVKAAWLAQVFAVASEEFQVHPYDEADPAAQDQADFIQDGIERLPLGSAGLIFSILAPLGPDGVSIVEPVSEIEVQGRWAGKWVPKAAKSKDVQLLYLLGDRYRNITAIRSLRSPELEDMDAVDFLITKYAPLFEEPFGWAPFRASLADWWLLDTVRKLRAIHHEKRTAGTMLGRYRDQNQKSTLERLLKSLRISTWGVIPEGVEIQLLEMTKASDTDYAKFEQDKIVAVVTGIAFAELQMLSGDVPDGRGNAKVHQDTSDLPKWYLSKLATETINRQFIPRYVDWNFGGVRGYPRFSVGGINPADIEQEMDQIAKLQAVGFDGQAGRPALSIKHYAKALGAQLADPRDPTDRLASGTPPTLPPQGGGFNPLSAFAELNAAVTKLAEEVRAKKARGR
ncbi:phage portal protein family protein [Limnoglobus roseus]|uniref:Phage portal protein n=1 Tax=Limnoglobus roseus TaxID=2598579 RepID=A0A5C1AN08_9BACT|nr:DUF935 family protein [Limnoglobus roseus]QEL18298.1 hypothetical protein PX52LOC_05319 [Limnoglobus roseus]